MPHVATEPKGNTPAFSRLIYGEGNWVQADLHYWEFRDFPIRNGKRLWLLYSEHDVGTWVSGEQKVE